MKRLLALLLLLLPVSAFAEANDIVLPATLLSNNMVEALCARYGSFCVRDAWITEGGTVIDSVSRYAYKNDDALRLAEKDSAGNTRILGSGKGFSVSEDAKAVLTFYPDPASFEKDLRAMRDAFFRIDCDEEIVSVTDAGDGTLSIKTTLSDPRGSIQKTYTVESGSFALRGIFSEILRKDGTRCDRHVITVTPGETFSPPDALKALCETGQTATARLVRNAGTDDVSICVIEYPEGAALLIVPPDGYTVLSDAEEPENDIRYLVENTKG